MLNSSFKTALLWIAGAILVSLAYNKLGWPGVMLTVGFLVFWMLLLYTRMLQTLRRAANNPKGFVSSAVMLNARLKPGLSLLQVISMTQALGETVSQQPEVWRWTDASQSAVECTFANGKLAAFALTRPTSLDQRATS